MYSLGLCVRVCYICYTSFTEMNSTNRCFSLIQRRTRQHSTDRYVARVRMACQMYVICNAVCMLYIALASFIFVLFVMYYMDVGVSGPSLLVESTNSMIYLRSV